MGDSAMETDSTDWYANYNLDIENVPPLQDDVDTDEEEDRAVVSDSAMETDSAQRCGNYEFDINNVPPLEDDVDTDTEEASSSENREENINPPNENSPNLSAFEFGSSRAPENDSSDDEDDDQAFGSLGQENDGIVVLTVSSRGMTADSENGVLQDLHPPRTIMFTTPEEVAAVDLLLQHMPFMRHSRDIGFLDDPHLRLLDMTPPASKEFISNLAEKAIEAEGEQCSICLKTYETAETTNVLPCNHIFHPECIVRWLSQTNTCPLCRTELPTDDEKYERFRTAATHRIRELAIQILQNIMENPV